MAHEICIQNGKASMMYVGEEPWHGLGTRLNKPATAEEAIKAANLDWTVVKKPIYAFDEDAAHRVPDKFAVVRADNWGKPGCQVFGIVGESYTPLQNREAFGFFDHIVGKGAAIYHTAGALGYGERIWILARLPSDIRVIGDDIANKYLLLSNSHDGASSVQVKFTPIRVVCQNTLTMALSKGPTVRVAHFKDLHHRLKNPVKMLGLIHKRYDEIEECFKKIARISMDKERLETYYGDVFPDPRDPEDKEGLNRARQQRLWAEYFFEQGKGNGMKDVCGTLWAAYNGVAEFIDYRKINSSKANQDGEKRLNSVWFGDGYLRKARAFEVAVEKIKAWAN